MQQWIVKLLATTLIGYSGLAQAEEGIQSLSDLQKLVAAEVRAGMGQKVNGRIKIQVGRFDSRLRLPACPKQQIEIFASNNNPQPGHSRVMGVRCNGQTGWTLYVPVNIRVEATILVAKMNLPRGTTITENMLSEQIFDINRIPNGYFQSKDGLINQVLRQPISQGQPIGPQQIQSAAMIKRGDTVQIRAKMGTLIVNMQGEALSNGGLNEVIHVRNLSSKKVIDGKVVANQTVEVAP